MLSVQKCYFARLHYYAFDLPFACSQNAEAVGFSLPTQPFKINEL